LGQRELEFSGVLAQFGGGADEPFKSEIGTLLPIAPCGRTRYSLYANPPSFAGIRKGQEPVLVQAFGSCCLAIARSGAAANNGSGSSRIDVDIANSSMRSLHLNGPASNASPDQAL
jgi:hypothetical protein